mgnify:CR=1 FL=1
MNNKSGYRNGMLIYPVSVNDRNASTASQQQVAVPVISHDSIGTEEIKDGSILPQDLSPQLLELINQVHADNDDIEANILSSTIKAPEEWYTPFLDAFFGVS